MVKMELKTATNLPDIYSVVSSCSRTVGSSSCIGNVGAIKAEHNRVRSIFFSKPSTVYVSLILVSSNKSIRIPDILKP